MTEAQKNRHLEEMALWYDGFCFDAGCSTRVFSTRSVLRFFSTPEAVFLPYWAEARAQILSRQYGHSDVFLDRGFRFALVFSAMPGKRRSVRYAQLPPLKRPREEGETEQNLTS